MVMFDYVDESNAGLAVGFSYLYPGDYKWLYTTSSTHAGSTYPSPQIPSSETSQWGHFEATFKTFHEIPFRMMFH